MTIRIVGIQMNLRNFKNIKISRIAKMKFATSIFKTFFLSLCIIANTAYSYAQTASILPNAKTTFSDKNGKPLTSGTVDFYIPGTSTRKTTWQDSAKTIPNTNPVTLDAAGRAQIWGDGAYRQVVKDRNNDLQWDQVTSSLGSGGSSTTTVGDGLPVGTILPTSALIAPANYQFAYGQTLSRLTYANLFAALTISTPIGCVGGSPLINVADTSNLSVGAVLESICIAGSPTIISKTSSNVTLSSNSTITVSTNGVFFPYGNGDALTTFNVPDLRGYVVAGRCNMGGVDCSTLNSTYFSSNASNTPSGTNAKGGSQSGTLVKANIPNYALTVNDPGHSHTTTITSATSTSAGGFPYYGSVNGTNVPYNSDTKTTGISVTSGGSGTPISLLQPTLTLNYVVKVLPDSNLTPSFGVGSIGGMTGIIACGANVTCAGNTISFNFVGVNSIQGMSGIITCGAGLTCSSNTISANSSTPQVVSSRTAAQALDLSSFSVVQTLGYSTGGDGGGATFKKISPTAPFTDSYVLTGTTIGGSGYTNGTYLGVPVLGGSSMGCNASITVAGGTVTAPSFASPCAGFKVGDVLTTPAAFIGGTGSGFTYTITSISTVTGSFVDVAGNRWQIVTDQGTFANVLQFGCKADWAGTDAGTTNNLNCMQNALAWASLPNSSQAASGLGGKILVPKGAFMLCGTFPLNNLYSLIVPAGVTLEGGSLQGTILVECAANPSGSHFIALCDSNSLVGLFGCKVSNMEISSLQITTSTAGAATIYSNSGQQFVLGENLEILAGLKSCIKYELGKGGAANDIWIGIDCVQLNASNPGFSLNSPTAQHILTNVLFTSATNNASVAISNQGGRLVATGIDVEGFGIGLAQNVSAGGVISSYKDVQQQSGGCSAAIQLGGSNLAGNLIMENISTGCPITVQQSAGPNWTSNVRGPMMCITPSACAAAVP